MKVAFAGTPDFAATILRGLISSPHHIGLVISQPDPRRGRGRKTQTTPVAALARTANLPLRQPAHISEADDEISDHDALVVAAYGQILRPNTLHAATYGAWNVHASLLPNYRGAAPIERAIMAGEHTTGVTIMRMDEGLDTGPIALQRTVEIGPHTTGGELAATLAEMGAKVIVDSLTLLESGSLTLVEQNSLDATYAAKLSDEDKAIRWEWAAWEVHNLVRALAPHVGARTFHEDFRGPVKIWRSTVVEGAAGSLGIGQICSKNGRLVVGCGSGVLEVLELQVPGSRRLSAEDFLRGRALDGGFSG
ncbi:MAG TPA: methionyl-tRNA formyltransferase [Rubrobacteraceae bacterium]|nr:methionyl-tRNA formyltransferase [Rubrobacteraceae bacterium]